MLLAEVVAASAEAAATRSRSAKVAAIAGLLGRLDVGEVEAAVAWLCGEPRQGKIGVGWATAWSVQVEAAPSATLTVGDVDAAFDALAALCGPGSAGLRHERLTRLLRRATAVEGSWIQRLLVGEVRQGALAGLVTDAVARAAGVPLDSVRRAAMLAGDLPHVAVVGLTGGDAALAAIGLDVGRPVQPMLASTSTGVAEALAELGRSSVEWKLDGARVQAHRLDGEVRLYTRNLNDVTDRLGAIAEVVRSLPVRAVVLDGEVVGDGDGERPGLFQDTMSRFSRHDGAGGLDVWFFDCLHLNGEDLIDRPLSQRRAALERAAGRHAVPAVVTEDPEVASAFLADALASGHEGVLVKALGSTYEAGRRGQAWRKVKPVRTLDLVVLAAEWGHGRRRGWLSNLHLGARDPGGGWVMVGKTFKGLTDALLAWQTDALLARQVDQRGITVFVRPELVVEVALDGAQVSSRYPGGVALRFARVRRYREDKAPEEADLIDAVRALLAPGPRRAPG